MKRLLLVVPILFLFISASHAQAIPPYHVNPEVSPGGHVSLTWEAGPADGLSEDFEDNLAQDFDFWTPNSPQYPTRGSYNINNGYVELESGWANEWASTVYTGIEFTNFTIEAQIQNTQGTLTRGILFRGDGPRDEDFNGYTFTYGYSVGYPNHYGIWKVTNGNATPIIYWTESNALIPGDNAINVLKLVASGTFFSFYINDIYVDNMSNSSYGEGFVGFVQAEAVTARYDYVSCAYGAELQNRSVRPHHGETLDIWLDEAGRPTDHPPVMAEDVEQAYIDARGSSATADHLKGLSSDEPRQHSLRGHRSRPSDNPDLASKSGQTRELDEFIEYHVYRNDQFIAATTDTVFTDQLPAYGDYEYRVTAYYDPEGESIPSVPATVNWQPVTYSLAPVNAVVPYSGGTITYDALLFNELPQAFQNVSYRVYATLPDGSEVGPLFQRNFTLAPGAYHSISGLTQTVPANAPPGNYFLHGRLYSQGQPVYEQTFQFDKMGGGE